MRLASFRHLLAGSALLVVVTACTGGSGPSDADLEPDQAVTEEAPERVLRLSGPDDGAILNADDVEALAVEVTMETTEGDFDLDDLAVLLNDDDVTADAQTSEDQLTWAPQTLPDGDHVIAVVSRPPPEDDGSDTDRSDTDGSDADAGSDTEDAEAAGVPPGAVLAQPVAADDDAEVDADEADDAGEPDVAEGVEVLRTWQVTVDATPPEVTLTSPEGAIVANEAVVFAGSTEPGATVRIADQETTADDAGEFELELASPPDGPLELVAIDAAGNETADEFSFVVVPSRATVDEVRAVHVSFCAWATPSLRDPIMQQIEDGLITAVQLDIKDETGKIGPTTEIELAQQTGAANADCDIDLDAAVEELHALDVPVIGRVVAFADPMLARWAWDNDQRDMVIQTAGGEMYTGAYAGFANFANDEVAEYNIAVAEEAAAAGVDHILWDYLRKPDGAVENFSFVGLEGEPMAAIADFVRRADERLAPYGVEDGASVYGISADRPTEVAQDIVTLSDHLDYMAPMIYPSHWGPGEYGVANPLMQPREMVENTLAVWLEVTDGKRARVLPWLEDSNWPIRLGYPDRASYVSEQIQGTYNVGIDEWMLWDSSVRYTEAGMLQPSGD